MASLPTRFGTLLVWRDTATAAVYYVSVADARNTYGEGGVTEIDGRIVRRSGSMPHEVGGVFYGTNALLERDLLGGQPLYARLVGAAVAGRCGAPPPAIRAFRTDAKLNPTPREEIYASASAAQRRMPWPLLWAGDRLLGMALSGGITLERNRQGVESVQLSYVGRTKNVSLLEYGARSTVTPPLRQLVRISSDASYGFGPGRQPGARVGATTIIFGSERRYSTAHWKSIIKLLHTAD